MVQRRATDEAFAEGLEQIEDDDVPALQLHPQGIVQNVRGEVTAAQSVLAQGGVEHLAIHESQWRDDDYDEVNTSVAAEFVGSFYGI
jgi:hypothetical protein